MNYADVFTRLSSDTPPEHLKPAGAPFAIATALTLLTKIVGLPLAAFDCPPPKLAQMFPSDHVPEIAVPVFRADLTRYQSWRRLLLDCQMPQMDGYEAASRMRALQLGRRLRIVAVTAHAQPGERERCIAAGMDDYLSKPVTMDALQRILGEAQKAARPTG